jgi:lysophospholipase L1-like esterase
MSFPDSLTTRTVKGRFVTFPQGAAGPATGYVLISLQNTMQGPDDNAFVLPFERRIDFDQNGEIEVILPATNDPQWSPSFYRISIHTQIGKKRSYDGCLEPIYRVQTYRLEIPYDSTDDLQLSDVLNVGLPQPGQLYVVRTMLGAANGVATLGSDGKVPSSQLPSSAGGSVDWVDVENKPATFPSDPVSWTDVEDKPATFPHDTVSWSEVQNKPTTFPASSVDWTGVQNKPTTFPASSVDWTGVQNKPTTYPHDAISWDEIEDKPDLSGGGTITWDAVSGKPSTFPPSTHTHIQSEVTGLTTALGGKSDVGHTHTQSDVSGLTSALTAKADASAVATSLSAKADTSTVNTALAAKADTTYVDSQLSNKANSSDVTSGLAAKANSSDVTTALSAKANSSDVTTSLASKADLVAGTIPTSQIPAIAITEFLGSVANQTAMLALVGQKGDWCIRTDLGQHWIITGSDSSQLASWTAIPLAAVPVQTVNGQTGTVVLGKADVGLGNVDNTSDANKPVSTAQTTALGLKAPLASPTFTGTVSGVTAAMVGLGNVDNTADASKPVSTAQQTALNLKAPLASPAFTGTVTGITASMVGLANVNNTSDASKPVSTTQQTALDLKAPLASPSLTGTPTAPTATAGTNTTQVATTAFVTTAVAAGGGGGSSSWTTLTSKPDFLTDHTWSLRRWYAALANRHYTPAKIAVVGDSIAEGIGASQFGRSWVPMTLNHLRDKFPVSWIPGGSGFVAAWDNPGMNYDVPAYTYPATWSSGTTVNYVGWSMKSLNTTASGVTGTYNFTGTSIHVWYIKQSGGGTFSVTIDGTVVAASVATTIASGYSIGVWTSSALAQGPHQIVITTTSASSIFINGFRVFDGDEAAGIQMFNGGQSGLKTGDFSEGTTTDGYSWASFLSTIAPQLVIVELGLNDWAGSVAIATVKANLKTIISTIRSGSATNPAIVLYASPWVNDGAYAYPFTTLRQCWLEVVAEDTGGYGGASGVALFDAAARFLSPQVDTSDGYYYNNGIHPSDKGHSAVADALTSFLSPV